MGLVIDEDLAKKSSCSCFKIGPTEEPKDVLCFSPGVIGALSNAQDVTLCTERHIKESKDGLPAHVEKFREASKVCVEEAKKFPKGERLIPRLECMGRELRARGLIDEKHDED